MDSNSRYGAAQQSENADENKDESGRTTKYVHLREDSKPKIPLHPPRPPCFNEIVKLLISAGEASGELYGAQLIVALRHLDPSLEVFGVGSDRMRFAGADIVVDSREIAVLGIAEILGHLPAIFRAWSRATRAAEQRRPDAAVVIDSPGFHLGLARRMQDRAIPVIYYVSPQLWAWRPWRIRRVRRYVRKVLVIFPFEEQWYLERGVDAEFVGHPLAEVTPPAITREEFAAEHGLDVQKHWIALLPGSRRKEITLNLPEMIAGAGLLQKSGASDDFVLPLAPTIDRAWVQQQLAPLEAPHGVKIHIASGDHVARAALKHARAAAVASGTATVEAALMNTPFVMVYRVTPLSWALGRKLVNVSNFAMANLIAGRRVVPELVQHDFTAARLAEELNRIIPEGEPRRAMLEGLDDIRNRLRASSAGPETAADRAARAVLATLNQVKSEART
jgi:lipid-A-disaccharide synthase